MYLKNIDIQGFKSFPEKIKVHFGDGITGIVGPNGSGKSNVCDAIRWVLGEQSTRTLRGTKMEDVVFSGTQKRKAVGFAEVSLTIDNQNKILASDYGEVTVKRRYYRSGESEYFINETPSRLKDIHELFMDTGLGRDGYSIIGQGRIAEILSLKSEDRRQIFEEASGITKYRTRRAEAERKLELTQTNLERIGDIAQELADRIGPLEVQADKAKKYLSLYEKLKGLEINAWLREADSQKAAIEKYGEDFAVAQMTLEQNQTDMEASDTEIEKLYEEMRKKDAECEGIRQAIREMEQKAGEAASRISILQNNIHNNQSLIVNLETQLQEGKTKAALLQEKIEECSRAVEGLFAEEQEITLHLKALLSNSEGLFAKEQTAGEEFKTKAASLSAAIGELSDRKIALSGLRAQYDALLEKRASIDGELEQVLLEKKNKEELLADLLSQLQSQTEEVTSAENILSGYVKKMQIVQGRFEEAQRAAAAGEKAYQEKTSRLALLQDLEREFAGFARSVKEIMLQKERGRLKGIEGTVSQMIRVKEETAVAVEVSLGSSLQNVIVGTEEEAKTAISFLKANNYGRATFLPVSAIRGGALREDEIREKEGFVGVASSLVSCDGRYRAIVESLLGRIVIARDLDSAVRMAQKNGYRFRIVTLDGQVVNAGGSMTGGSLNQNAGVLSRANEIERLKAELVKMEETLRAQKAQAEKSKGEKDLLAARMEDCQAVITEGQRLSGLLKERVSAQREAIAGTEGRISSLLREKEEGSRREAEIKEAVGAGEAGVAAGQAAIDELTLALDQIRGSQEKIAEAREIVSAEILEKKLAVQAKQKDRQAVGLQIGQIEGQIDELLDQGGRRNTDIDEIRAQIAAFEKEIEGQKEVAAGWKEAIVRREELIAAETAAKLQIEAQISKRQKEAASQRNRLLDLQKEYARLESRLSAARLNYENILNKMWESYELSYTAAQQYRREDSVSAAEANRTIAALKEEIRGLGNVNLDAIEEYREVSERLAFITGQREDLEKAKAGLLSVIENMLAKMREIFSVQFQIINTEFSKTFSELFGGGKALLELTDPSDLLGSGIEIKVQPPGKNVRSLSLLSGGEQAFVAIALIFAILRVRPTPFCVFDEIEAALDDVNIGRFVSYLNRYKDQIQFILITHRRATMEAADILYGVTMQERGVSKLLAINIAEIERHIKVQA